MDFNLPRRLRAISILTFLHYQVNDTQSKITDIKASLNQSNHTYAARNDHQLVSSLATRQSNSSLMANQPMSSKRQFYAADASDGLCDVVKFDIAETIKEQKAAERDRARVAIHGIRESRRFTKHSRNV